LTHVSCSHDVIHKLLQIINIYHILEIQTFPKTFCPHIHECGHYCPPLWGLPLLLSLLFNRLFLFESRKKQKCTSVITFVSSHLNFQCQQVNIENFCKKSKLPKLFWLGFMRKCFFYIVL